MSKAGHTLALALASSLGASAGSFAQVGAASGTAGAAPVAPAVNDWPTWGYDPERTGWNRGETTLSKANVAQLRVQWSRQLPTPPNNVVLSTVTAPVLAAGVSTPQGPKNLVFLLGADDVLFALDADTGATVWSKSFPNPIKPGKIATWLCSNTANATPTIDRAKGLIYLMASDGKLRGLNLADGSERLTPTEMVAPFARAWSLNLIDDVVYTTSGRACGEVLDPRSPWAAAIAPRRGFTPPAGASSVTTDPSAVTAIDVRDPARPEVTRFFTSGGRPAGAWGRGGAARGPGNSVILQTSDGLYDPGSGNWADTILRLAPKATRVQDSFTPENYRYIASKDLGGSTTPVVFPFGGKTLVATAQKEGVLYLLDADDMGGGVAGSHAKYVLRTKLGNDGAVGTDPGQGVWGAITTYLTPGGRRFLYVPLWGPPSSEAPVFRTSNGPTPDGSIMAFEVVSEAGKISLVPQWISPNMILPDPPVVANGVVYAIQTGGQALQNPKNPDGTRVDNSTPFAARYRATPVSNLVLHALDAETGKPLYSSGKAIPGWVHFSEPVVALGKVFVVTHDAKVYAFGVSPPVQRRRGRR